MARSDARYSIYPAPKAIEIVGNTAPDLNLAVECWAALVKRAMADNDRTFFPIWNNNQDPVKYHHYMHDWAIIAEALRGMRFDPDFAKPSELVATAVEDAHRLECLGAKWYRPIAVDGMKDLDNEVSTFVSKLKALDYEHAWAVILAVQWFWEHDGEGVQIDKSPWWTLTFRREWAQEQDEREPERMRMELNHAREQLQVAAARLKELEIEARRGESARAQLEKANAQIAQARMRLVDLQREAGESDQKRVQAQLEKARNQFESAQENLKQLEHERYSAEAMQAQLKVASEQFQNAKAHLNELESKVRDKMRTEREKAREELERSETRLKVLEDKIRDLGAG